MVSTKEKESDRQELQQALRFLIDGHELVVTKLDRLGRTQVEVINRLHSLQQSGIHVRTLDGLINTRALGKMAPLIVGLLTGLAEVERELIKERTVESIAHRKRTGGSLGGRPKTSQARANLVLSLRSSGDSYRAVREKTGIGLATIRRIILDSPD
jgi:DNA invertase Pin-like site-specific DNA recombinase